MTILNAAPRIRKLRKRQQPLDVSLAPQTNNLFIFPNYPPSRKVGPMALRVPRYHQAPTAQPSSRRISAAIVTEIAATVGSNFPDFDRQLNQIKTPLNDLQPAIERLSIFADDRGAAGNGTTDDAAVIQSAMDELNAAGGGRLIFTPGKSYLSSVIYCKPNIVIDLNRATLIAKASSDNELFAFGVGIAGQTKIALTSAVQGTTSITVSDSSSFVIGERILISAGTFTGSGVEEGPIEYNTVTGKPDGTHITVQRPLRYSYSAFGLPGAANPGIYRVESFSRGLIHDVRIMNGTLKAKTGDSVVMFNGSGERIEVCNLLIDGIGSQMQTGGYLSQYSFHDNIVKGLAQVSGGGGLNGASIVESWIQRNSFQMGDDSGTDNHNGLHLEVTCRDNFIADNNFGPKRSTNGGAIEITAYGFNNIITRNKIWGLASDINSGTGTIGIRTYANSSPAPAGLGNLILGNQVIDVMQAIGDILPESIIGHNVITFNGSHANTQGIISNSGKGIFGPNRITGATTPYWDGSSAVPRIQTDIDTRPIFWGTGSPEGVVTASVGALFIRSDGGAATTLYAKESGTGNTGWKAIRSAGALISLTADVTGTLPIANGGTNQTTQTSNGVNYYDGSKITSGSGLQFDGTNFGVGGASDGTREHVQVAGSSSAISNATRIENTTTATANGQGIAVNYVLATDSGVRTDVGSIAVIWTDKGNATRASAMLFMTKAAGASAAEKARLDSTGQFNASSVRGTAVTVANLPATPVEGMLVGVTDSNTNVWGATIAGGGTNHVLAYYNGTNWTVAGK